MFESNLFFDFLHKYARFFEYPKKTMHNDLHARFVWTDAAYSLFMMEMLKMLEPISY